jgi:hypothetical protein
MQMKDAGPWIHREVVYTGRDGKVVERVVAANAAETKSYIYKPIMDSERTGKERWAERCIFPCLPMVRFPKLVSETNHYLLYEDLGTLEHRFDLEVLTAAAAAIAHLHVLPVETVPAEFAGHTPAVEEIVNILRNNDEEWEQALRKLDADHRLTIQSVREHLLDKPAFNEHEIVVSHGDFHPLNIALPREELVILDWEFIHRNSVYWDLYNLLDITSPAYRKPPMDAQTRLSVLNAYAKQRKILGKPAGPRFLKGYHRFGFAYSVWLLLLIERDLLHDRFDRDCLLLQREETLHSLRQFVSYLA